MHDVGGGAAARVISADNGLGHVAGHVGMDRAIELAREFGVGTVMVRDSNHYGASGYWARLALAHTMVGFAFTSATARIAPWGGTVGGVGNNPPAWAVPTRVVDEGESLSAADADSVFLDIALSVVAGNRLDIYRRRGEPLPEGWALDGAGEPTTDAQAAQHGGTYAPLGGYKGSGMAIVLSLINSFLSGGLFDDERIRDGRPVPGTVTHWFAAYDVRQFVPADSFTSQVRAVRERVRANPPRAGVDRVLAPGRPGERACPRPCPRRHPLRAVHARRARLGRRAHRRGAPAPAPGGGSPSDPARPRLSICGSDKMDYI